MAASFYLSIKRVIIFQKRECEGFIQQILSTITYASIELIESAANCDNNISLTCRYCTYYNYFHFYLSLQQGWANFCVHGQFKIFLGHTFVLLRIKVSTTTTFEKPRAEYEYYIGHEKQVN